MTDPKKPAAKGQTVAVVGSGRSAAEIILALQGQVARNMTPDPVTSPPALAGEYGRAWELSIPAFRMLTGSSDRTDALVAFWVLEVPGAHPFWHSYALTLIHLRPLESVGPPSIYRHDATHELVLHALDPQHSREGLLKGAGLPVFLEPANFGAQLAEESDEAAAALVKAAVVDVVNGVLNPDTDHTSVWIRRFGDSMMRNRGSVQ